MCVVTMSNDQIKKRDKEKTCNKIIAVAQDLFLERGFSAVSTKEIAKAADINHSLIHYHFGTKRQLWDIIKAKMFTEATEAAQATKQSLHSREGLLNYIDWRANYIKQHPDFVRLILWSILEFESKSEPGEPPKEVRERILTLIDSVRKAQAAGEIRDDIYPVLVHAMILGATTMWYNWQANWLFDPELNPEQPHITFDEYLAAMKTVLTEGLFPRD